MIYIPLFLRNRKKCFRMDKPNRRGDPRQYDGTARVRFVHSKKGINKEKPKKISVFHH